MGLLILMIKLISLYIILRIFRKFSSCFFFFFCITDIYLSTWILIAHHAKTIKLNLGTYFYPKFSSLPVGVDWKLWKHVIMNEIAVTATLLRMTSASILIFYSSLSTRQIVWDRISNQQLSVLARLWTCKRLLLIRVCILFTKLSQSGYGLRQLISWNCVRSHINGIL